MPSMKNPNGPSKNRLAARAAKKRQSQLKKSTAGKLKSKIAKADATRGARPGLAPTSGPNKPISSKKRRKMEKQMGYALKRKMEADGEVEMKDASGETEKTANEKDSAIEQQMDVEDGQDIS